MLSHLRDSGFKRDGGDMSESWITKHLTERALESQKKQDIEAIDRKIGHERKHFIARLMKAGMNITDAIAKWDREQDKVVVEK